MKRVLTLILSAGLLIGTLAACGNNTDDTTADTTPEAEVEETEAEAGETEAGDVQIVTWHTLTDHHEEALHAKLAAFNDSQERIEVIAEQQPYSEFDAKLMQSVSAGVGPDFVSLFASAAGQYIDQGFLTDMAPYINDADNGIPNFQEELSDGVWDEITQWGDDSIYMIPATHTGEVLFYNQNWYDELGLEVPETWTQLEENSKIIYEAKGVPGFGSDSIMDTFLDIIIQAGSDYVDADTAQVAVDKDIVISELNWFANAVDAGHFRLVGEDQYFSNPFGSQAVGSYIGSSAGIDFVGAGIPAEGEEGHFEFAVAPIPQEGPVQYINYWGGGDVNLAVTEEKQDAVYEYLKYNIQPEVVADWAIAFGAVPVYESARELPEFQEYLETNKAANALNAQSPYIGHIPSLTGSDAVRNEMDKMIQTVALGTVDAETAYETFVEASNAVLQD